MTQKEVGAGTEYPDILRWRQEVSFSAWKKSVQVGHHILFVACSSINWESEYMVNIASTEYGSPSSNIDIAFYDAENNITL